MEMRELTNEQIIDMVPAVGATKPYYKVSDRYSFVPTVNAINLIRDNGWLPIQARTCGVRIEERNGFQKHMIRFSIPWQLQNAKEERVDLVLYNSHDRGSAFNLMASIWRKVCSNGLMVASRLFSFKHKHIGFDRNAFVVSAQKISNGAYQISDRINEFKHIELIEPERKAFAKTVLMLTNHNITPEKLLTERRYDDKGKDLWTTYNVIQENLMKGGLSYIKRDANNRFRRNKTRAIKSLDRDIKLNRALWTLTEKMAELKGSKTNI